MKNEYETFEGYTTGKSTEKKGLKFHKRVFNLNNGDKEIHVTAYTYWLEVGVYMEVNYLPNSGFATVVYRSDKPDG